MGLFSSYVNRESKLKQRTDDGTENAILPPTFESTYEE